MSTKNVGPAVWTHPSLNAAVVLERRGRFLLLDFLVKGTSQKRKGGVVVGSTPRNPDRRALVEHVCAELAEAGAKPVGGFARGTWTDLEDASGEAIQKAFGKAGNFRWSLFVKLPAGNLLGLIPMESHRAVKTSWPAEVSS